MFHVKHPLSTVSNHLVSSIDHIVALTTYIIEEK